VDLRAAALEGLEGLEEFGEAWRRRNETEARVGLERLTGGRGAGFALLFCAALFIVCDALTLALPAFLPSGPWRWLCLALVHPLTAFTGIVVWRLREAGTDAGQPAGGEALISDEALARTGEGTLLWPWVLGGGISIAHGMAQAAFEFFRAVPGNGPDGIGEALGAGVSSALAGACYAAIALRYLLRREPLSKRAGLILSAWVSLWVMVFVTKLVVGLTHSITLGPVGWIFVSLFGSTMAALFGGTIDLLRELIPGVLYLSVIGALWHRMRGSGDEV